VTNYTPRKGPMTKDPTPTLPYQLTRGRTCAKTHEHREMTARTLNLPGGEKRKGRGFPQSRRAQRRTRQGTTTEVPNIRGVPLRGHCPQGHIYRKVAPLGRAMPLSITGSS